LLLIGIRCVKGEKVSRKGAKGAKKVLIALQGVSPAKLKNSKLFFYFGRKTLPLL
jgi:hypothetical protein